VTESLWDSPVGWGGGVTEYSPIPKIITAVPKNNESPEESRPFGRAVRDLSEVHGRRNKELAQIPVPRPPGAKA
jgi:hypothetical protein